MYKWTFFAIILDAICAIDFLQDWFGKSAQAKGREKKSNKHLRKADIMSMYGKHVKGRRYSQPLNVHSFFVLLESSITPKKHEKIFVSLGSCG